MNLQKKFDEMYKFIFIQRGTRGLSYGLLVAVS